MLQTCSSIGPTLVYLLGVLASCLAMPLSALLMEWFDRKLTMNPDLRLQANFECVFGLMFTGLTVEGALAPDSAGPLLWFDSKIVTLVLFIYSANCLLLSIPAMLGVRMANKLLFYLAWLRLLLPCIGWFFSFFAIRYYLLGMRRETEKV